MSLANKSILVTGGAGFIGSHLVDALIREGAERIIVVDNLSLGKLSNIGIDLTKTSTQENLGFFCVDASNCQEMKALLLVHPVDIAFNLAVVPLPASLIHPEKTFRENMDLAITIAELARNDLFKTLIHFSSSEVYGTNISDKVPMNEDHPLNGTTTYAASKAAADLLVLSYVRTFGIDASIIRPFNNYGPRQNENQYAAVIPATIKRILHGETPVVNGNGLQTRDYLYVTDTVDAALKIYNKTITRGNVLNIASGKEISIGCLIKTICNYMGYAGETTHAPERIGDVRRHIANIYRAEDLIGFKPTVGFEDGIKRTIDWYRRIG